MKIKPSARSNPQPIGVCVILQSSRGEVLVGKRRNSYKAGMYGCPGGRIEVNEPIVKAMRREVLEETGIQLTNYEYVGVVRENQFEYDFLHFVYIAEIGEIEPQRMESDKCEGWKWVEIKTIATIDLLPGHAAAIRMFNEKEKLADLTR